MEIKQAVVALSALAQENRLDVYRMLVQAGPRGMAAGQIATKLGIAPNTLTFHFDRLRQAGLIMVSRNGRSMIYAAHLDVMNTLVVFLTENCCGTAGSCTAPVCRPADMAGTAKDSVA